MTGSVRDRERTMTSAVRTTMRNGLIAVLGAVVAMGSIGLVSASAQAEAAEPTSDPTVDWTEVTVVGTVTDPEGNPAQEGCAYLFHDGGDPDGGDPYTIAAVDCVDDEGDYSLSVGGGDYRLLLADFTDADGAALVDEWYDDAPTFEQAPAISVSSNSLVIADAQLEATDMPLMFDFYDTIHLNRTATADSGCVWAFTENGELATWDCVEDSNQAVLALRPDSYMFLYTGFEATSDGRMFPDQWHGGRYSIDQSPGGLAWPPTDWPSGVPNAPFWAYLERGASLTGTVSVLEGASLDGSVEVYEADSGIHLGTTSVGPDGSYAIDGLLGNSRVNVLFRGFTGAGNEWYTDVPTPVEAITVVLPQDGGPAIVDETLEPEGVISGLFDVPPTFDEFVCVTAWYSGLYRVSSACGEVGGPFKVRRLLEGSYLLEFTDDSGHSAYYRALDESGDRTTVSVTAGATTVLDGYRITLSGLNEYVEGSQVTVSVTARRGDDGSPYDEPVSGETAEVWHQLADGSWSMTLTPVYWWNDQGSFTVRPYGTQGFRVVLGGRSSGTFTLSPVVPEVVVTSPGQYVKGMWTTLSIEVDPAVSGTAKLWYRNFWGPWVEDLSEIPIEDGAGSVSVRPSFIRYYRIEFAGETSNAVLLKPAIPDVTVVAPDSYISGTPLTLDVTVDPVVSGEGTLWCQLPLLWGLWVETSTEVWIIDGTASVEIPPYVRMRGYRIEFAGEMSNEVSPTPIVPTITMTGPEVVETGDIASFEFTVEPAISGTGKLWVRSSSGSWLETDQSVHITSGTGSAAVIVSSFAVEYRLVMGDAVSNSISLDPIDA